MSAPTMNLEQRFLNSLLLSLLFQSCTSINTITSNKSISDGDLLVSNGKNFALGFFSPGSSSNRYVGIWYNKVSEQTVVWVANRDNPINDTDGILSITKHGNLLLSAGDIVFWSSNVSDTSIKNCVAQLLDTGNLILIQSITKKVIWQSFDYPTDTFLPNMKLGLNRRTGLNMFLTSWKSPDDPGTGDSLFRFDENGSPQLVLFKGPVRLWRTGPWNGYGWSGVPQMTHYIFNSSFVDNHDELSLTFGIRNTSIFSRMVANESGSVQRFNWHEGDRRWIEYYSAPKERCDNYGQCGWNGNCNPYTADEFECTCLPEYEPKSPHDWYLRDGSEGCVRKRAAAFTCGKGDGFVKVEHVKVPDTSTGRVERSMSLKACEEECLRNCTCTAYTSANISGGGNGCVSWHGDLIDTRVYSNAGQDLFIRVDAVVLAQYAKKSKSKTTMVAILVVSGAVILLLAVSLLYWLVSKRKRVKRGQLSLTYFEDTPRANELDGTKTNSNLPLFDLSTITAATDNFSTTKKLGQGGFGAVYKGQLLNGQEIAVKRLSKSSGQGIEEFMNEVTLIAKLQHRNLVRLLGCCIQKEEKMLIYEYLPNKSLDSFIFDETRRSLLDWRKRFEIICGIARGILYLHQDSRLRIIHRDLKASNVLLDVELNPKISDFGLARIFGGDQIEGNTNRVVGTYGYMSPEYAMEGLFSIKSDVFSFGVLLIEIITGIKNSGFYHESSSSNLIGHVWDLWREGKSLEMVDSSLGDSYLSYQIQRCIQIGLLCVQDNAIDRPTMLGVVFMLGNDTTLPSPKKPAFIVRRAGYNSMDPSTTGGGTSPSVNGATITLLGGR